jgi:hypothetical protein
MVVKSNAVHVAIEFFSPLHFMFSATKNEEMEKILLKFIKSLKLDFADKKLDSE